MVGKLLSKRGSLQSNSQNCSSESDNLVPGGMHAFQASRDGAEALGPLQI